MKIAHLSDLHFDSVYKRTNIGKTKRIIKYALDEGFDHLVITGDLSDNSEKKDYIILRRMLESFNLLDPSRCSIVIGNHDIYGGAQRAIDVMNFPSRCINTNYDLKVNEFGRYFGELFEGTKRFSDTNPFPYAKDLGDVVLYGINSIDTYSKLKNPFASNGKIKDSELTNLSTLFNYEQFKDKIKCVLVHHHFYKNGVDAIASMSQFWNKIENYTLKLRDKKKVLKLFAENDVKLVFHGHSHEIKEYYRKGIKFLNAGAGIDNFNDSKSTIIFANIGADEITSEIKNLSTSIIKMPEGKPEIFSTKDDMLYA